MRKLTQKGLQTDVRNMEWSLHGLKRSHGKESEAYRAAQVKLLRLWSMLKMTRSPQEFLEEIQPVSSGI